MNSVASLSPSEEYKQRLRDRELRVAQFDRIDKRMGNVRLVVVIAALVDNGSRALKESSIDYRRKSAVSSNPGILMIDDAALF